MIEIELDRPGWFFVYWPDSQTWAIEFERPDGKRRLIETHSESFSKLLGRLSDARLSNI